MKQQYAMGTHVKRSVSFIDPSIYILDCLRSSVMRFRNGEELSRSIPFVGGLPMIVGFFDREELSNSINGLSIKNQAELDDVLEKLGKRAPFFRTLC